MTWHEERLNREACARKVYHACVETAEHAARIAQERTGDVIHAYACEVCKGWHVGHPPPKKNKLTPDGKKVLRAVVRKDCTLKHLLCRLETEIGCERFRAVKREARRAARTELDGLGYDVSHFIVEEEPTS